MSKNQEIYFVWVYGPKEPQPQIWFHGMTDRDGKMPRNVLSYHKIDEEDAELGFNYLQKTFPAPEKKED